jgi:hypothetical protein
MWQSNLLKFISAKPEDVSHQAIASPLTKLKVEPKERWNSFVRISLISLSFATILGWSGASWLVQNAIAPQVAQAYTARVNVSLKRKVDESYQNMVRRAEAEAKAAAQSSFNKDRSVTDVNVTVLAENQGFIAPIVSMKVSRQAWKSRPDPKRWATYLPHVESLLGVTDNLASRRQTATPTGVQTPLPVFPPGTNTQRFPPGFPQNPNPGYLPPVPQQQTTTPNGQPTPGGATTNQAPRTPGGATPNQAPTTPGGATTNQAPTRSPRVPSPGQTQVTPGTTTTPQLTPVPLPTPTPLSR